MCLLFQRDTLHPFNYNNKSLQPSFGKSTTHTWLLLHVTYNININRLTHIAWLPKKSYCTVEFDFAHIIRRSTNKSKIRALPAVSSIMDKFAVKSNKIRFHVTTYDLFILYFYFFVAKLLEAFESVQSFSYDTPLLVVGFVSL